jgi:hypothetical protein
MTGHQPFSELTKGFTPARRARVAAKAAALREAMTLEELRKAHGLSQGRPDHRFHAEHVRTRNLD